MPYQQKSGQYNQFQWFLTQEEVEFLEKNKVLENKKLFQAFNDHFQCHMTYSRMRHFIAQYDLKKYEKGEKYTDAEYAYVTANFNDMSDMHMGQAIGRTPKSVLKIRQILKLKRTPEATKRLRHFRSCNGAKTYHARVAKGELEHPATHLHDSFVQGQIKKGTGLESIPQPLINLKRQQLLINRELLKIKKNESESKKASGS